MIRNIPIENITKKNIDELVSSKTKEDLLLDYKAQLNLEKPNEKKEFLADVSSFANASGGDIVYGIHERRVGKKSTGEPEKALGFKIENIDETKQRLENLIRDGIDPRVFGARVRIVDGFQNGSCIIIRVPKSWAAPHMVTYDGSFRFYTRNNAGRHPMKVSEVRETVMLTESLHDRIREFRRDRLDRIAADEAPVSISRSLLGNGKVVFHALPISSFDRYVSIDVISEVASNSADLANILDPIGHPSSHRYNFDGYVRYSSGGKPCGYVQLFRNGAIEAFQHLDFFLNERRRIKAKHLESHVLKWADNFIKLQERLSIHPPFMFLLSLLSVKGYSIAETESAWGSGDPIDRSGLLLPEILLMKTDESLHEVLRPAFDIIWQSAGHEHSPTA